MLWAVLRHRDIVGNGMALEIRQAGVQILTMIVLSYVNMGSELTSVIFGSSSVKRGNHNYSKGAFEDVMREGLQNLDMSPGG